MTRPLNISNAIVILGCLYALFTYEMGGWAKTGIIFILLFSLATWGIWTNPFLKQEKTLLEKRIEETEARTRNLNSLTAFNTSTALLNREQAIWYKTHH
jgi:CHASE1-domain containing sensor protein